MTLRSGVEVRSWLLLLRWLLAEAALQKGDAVLERWISVCHMFALSSHTYSLRSIKAQISILALVICLVVAMDRIGRGLCEGWTRTDLAHLLTRVRDIQ